MVKLPQDFAFADQALDRFRIFGHQFRLEALNGYSLTGVRIPSAIDFTHATGGNQVFLNKALSGRERWCRLLAQRLGCSRPLLPGFVTKPNCLGDIRPHCNCKVGAESYL